MTDYTAGMSKQVPHREHLITGLGAFFGIACCYGISSLFVNAASTALIIASMGAGSVLLFAASDSPLSQPWPAIGGHLFSAYVGVACARWVPELWLAAAMAVGLAVVVMHYTRCLHPPGGATALVAVIGGPDIHALGFHYVWTPVMLNAVTLFLSALLFNMWKTKNISSQSTQSSAG